MELQPLKANYDRSCIIQLIKTSGKKKDILTLRRIHADKAWIIQDISVANTLIRSYAKCGALAEAQEVFDQLVKRDVVSWSALIAGYAHQGLGEEALTCFREMESDGVIPNSITYASSLKACASVRALDVVEEIHAEIRDQELLKSNTILGTALVNAYAKCGALKDAQEIFNQLPERNVVSWSALIAGYVDHGFGEEALACFREMKTVRVIPNSVTYICTLKACATVRALEVVEEIHAQLRSQGLIKKDIALGTALVDAYAKCGALKKAQKVFDQLVERDVVSWGALIAGYADQGFGEEALTCFWKMQSDGVTPNSVTYACCLKACAVIENLDLVEEIHNKLRDEGLLKSNNVLGTALVDAYAKCGALMEAQKVFDNLYERNVFSWSALIAGYVDQGFGEEALTCFRDMHRDGVDPNSVTYACCLKACAAVGVVEIVQEIHVKLREKELMNEDIVLGTALVDAYAKCGAVKEAQEVFDHLPEQNVESWSALLAGYAQLGDVNKMLDLFNTMMSRDILPNLVTFVVLLNGCSHGALLEEGLKVFEMMRRYGLAPTPEHYTCMVDLFGRAGQFDKAKSFVLDHTSTLLAFLGACRKWVNVDLGKWAFEELLQLDDKCASAYVCMSNIYAAAGMMKEADEIEYLRVKGKVSKELVG